MRGKRTPSPSMDQGFGCGLAVVLFTLLLGLPIICFHLWGFLIVMLIPLAIVAYWLRGKYLLFKAQRQWKAQSIRGVLVYSDSPNWKSYIESNWLPVFRDRFVILNWSQRKQWEPSLERSLFRRFCGPDENYNPAIILLRGLRAPLVFRFFYAFRDAKHGNVQALNDLERVLLAELDLTLARPFPRDFIPRAG